MADNLFSKNFFEIFDIPVATDVDLAKISAVNHALQKKAHPDRFAHASEQQKRIAMQQTSLINEAYHTLKDPLNRIQYMLKLKGMEINSETDTTMDGVFLMQQMEFREAIAEVRKRADPLDELDKMARQTKTQIAELMTLFNKTYAQSALDDARELVRKMQFLRKAEKEINTVSAQLEDEMF
jgi:molecular chaperone HscB